MLRTSCTCLAAAPCPAQVPRTSSKPVTDQERRKGIPWTEEEHRLFLMGLAKFGKGDWRSISRNFVVSRTPTQACLTASLLWLVRLGVSGG